MRATSARTSPDDRSVGPSGGTCPAGSLPPSASAPTFRTHRRTPCPRGASPRGSTAASGSATSSSTDERGSTSPPATRSTSPERPSRAATRPSSSSDGVASAGAASRSASPTTSAADADAAGDGRAKKRPNLQIPRGFAKFEGYQRADRQQDVVPARPRRNGRHGHGPESRGREPDAQEAVQGEDPAPAAAAAPRT